MTMHLVGPYMTTTRYNNSKKKSKKTQSQIQAEQAHEKYLRKMGVHPDQREQNWARSSVRLEPAAHNGLVGGSNPSGPTNKSVKCYGSTSVSKTESRGSTPCTDAKLNSRKIKGVGVGTQGELIPLSAADYRSREGSIPSAPTNLPVYDPSMAKREPQVYNGERKLLGIATMHKSNMVPVFSKDDAEEIAKMRRG